MNQPETATHTYTPLAATFCDQCADHFALDPDELRAPGTDDEPWTVPEPDPGKAAPGLSNRDVALVIVALVLAVVAVVWSR